MSKIKTDKIIAELDKGSIDEQIEAFADIKQFVNQNLAKENERLAERLTSLGAIKESLSK